MFWLDGSKDLSARAGRAIEKARRKEALFVSSMSVWEVALLVRRGRLRLALALGEWLRNAEQVSGLQYVPVDNGIALESVELPGPLHDDPADRIIIATARKLSARVATRDPKIQGYPHLRTVW